MARSENTTTYSVRLLALKKNIESLKEQMQAEQDFVASLKTPSSLLRAFLSPSVVRSSDLFQITQARSKISQLQLQCYQAEVEMQDVERLRTQFPEHDKLIEKAAHVSFRSWSVSIQEDELDLYDREMMVEMKIEDQRQREEAAALEKDLKEVEQQQRELDAQQRELERKKAKLARRRTHQPSK